jgi:uncharacterized small protein (DUF1192 family)
MLKKNGDVKQTAENKKENFFILNYDVTTANEFSNGCDSEFTGTYDSYTLLTKEASQCCYRSLYSMRESSIFYLYFNQKRFTSKKDERNGLMFALESEIARFNNLKKEESVKDAYNRNLAWGIQAVLGIESEITSGNKTPFFECVASFDSVDSFSDVELEKRIQSLSEKIEKQKKQLLSLKNVNTKLKEYGVGKFKTDFMDALKIELNKMKN